MVRAGERAGTLAEIVDPLAVYMEKVDAIRGKVRAAMSYPVFVLVFAVVVTAFLLFKIVPTFEQIYGDFGQELPHLTRVVVGASNAIRERTLVALLVVGPCPCRCWRSGRARPLHVRRLLLRVPLFARSRKAAMSASRARSAC
jgi:type IV pilus assembly protein PilC